MVCLSLSVMKLTDIALLQLNVETYTHFIFCCLLRIYENIKYCIQTYSKNWPTIITVFDEIIRYKDTYSHTIN